MLIINNIDSGNIVENIKNLNIKDLTVSINESEIIAKKWIEDILIKQKIIKSIEWTEFSHYERIGSGNFGLVYKAYWPKIHNYVVYKKLIISSDIQSKIWEAFKHELQIQIRAHSCENIIRILGISESKLNI